MKSHCTKRFRRAFQRLPSHVQRKAREAFRLWEQDPSHPALRFKQVHPSRPIYSARIGMRWRALGVRTGDDMIWFWIGSHEGYDRLLSEL